MMLLEYIAHDAAVQAIFLLVIGGGFAFVLGYRGAENRDIRAKQFEREKRLALTHARSTTSEDVEM